VRALAPQATTHNFTINAVGPDMVPMGLVPPGLMEVYPAVAKTPMAMMLRVYDELLGLGGRRGWPQNEQVVEVIVEDLFYQEQPRLQRKEGGGGGTRINHLHGSSKHLNV
jgi:hypothetical protein